MDHARSVDLCEHALEFAQKVLKPKGTMVLKIFEGDMMPQFMKRVKGSFKDVKLYGPEASRSSSSEIYIVAKDFKPETSASKQ